MTIKRKLQTELREKLASKTELAVRQALAEEGSAPNLKDALGDLENYSKLVAATEPGWTRDSTTALAVALVCIAGAGMLWSCKVRRTNVSLLAESDSLHAELHKDWTLEEPIRGHVMHFADLSAVHNDSHLLDLERSDGDIWFAIEGGEIILRSLKVDGNATLDLFSDKDEFGLSAGGAPLRGTVQISGKGRLTGGTRDSTLAPRAYDLAVPEVLVFATQNVGASTSGLVIHSPGNWSLGVISCRALSFSSEVRSISERRIVSGVRSGSIQFNDTSWPVTQLFENQLLSVSGAGQARVRVRSDHEAMHVTLDGLVSRVTLGDSEMRRELAPSYLEYLYNQKSWLLFCGAISTAWGLLWSVRKTIFR